MDIPLRHLMGKEYQQESQWQTVFDSIERRRMFFTVRLRSIWGAVPDDSPDRRDERAQ